MRIRSTLLTILLIGAWAPCAQATIHHVNPGDQINQAIGNANSGDTIVVTDGTYSGIGNRDLSFGSKDLVVKSQNGPQATIIDCGAFPWGPHHRGFLLDSGQTSASRIEGFTFINASANDFGGGIKIVESSPTIVNCIFDSCYANLSGPGIACLGPSSPRIENCVFNGCQTDFEGGGLGVLSSSPVIENCTFVECASPNGGAVLVLGYYFGYPSGTATPQFNNCVFDSNWAIQGGAVYAYDGADPTFTNCTFFSNDAASGSAFYIWNATADLNNCIIANGTRSAAFDCDAPTATPSLSCSDVFGNSGGDWVGCIAGQSGAAGNFSKNPLFCDAPAGDFGLLGGSPCQPDSTGCGLVGASGVGCGGGHAGPYWYVATTGSDVSGTGSFASPWATIQHAIEQAPAGDSVLVLDGTYSGIGNFNIDFNNKSLSVASLNGAEVCIIDCDTARGFVFNSGEGGSTRIQGFTIREGSEEAIYCWKSSPTILDMILEDGIRGITCKDSASPTIRRCTFRNNFVPDGYLGGGIGSGAGIECFVGLDSGGVVNPAKSCDPVIDSCVFENNRAYIGSAIRTYHCQPLVTHSLFVGNGLLDTTGIGAGVYVSDGEGPQLTQCTFVDNRAANGAAVAVQMDGHVTIDRCILAYNQLYSAIGGPVFCDHNGTVTLTCSNVFGNEFGDYTNCIAGDGGINGNFSLDPIFCDTSNGDFQLRGHSPCQPGYPLNTCNDYIGAWEVGCLGPVWVACNSGCDLSGDGTFAHPWLTIEHGVNSTPVGDTLVLLPGTYTGTGNRAIDFAGKAIKVTSFWGSDSTTVDMNNYADGFLFDDSEGSATIIEGLTFRGASQAAVRCSSASPTIVDCAFRFNSVAIDLRDGSDSYIGYCDFISNIQSGANASGIVCVTSSPQVIGCWFEGNLGTSGGALYATGNGADPLIENCLFIRNGRTLYQTDHAASIGATNFAQPTVRSCTFFGNMAVRGSALYTQDADMLVEQCIIAFNYDRPLGSPVYCLGFSDNIDLSCTDVFGNNSTDFGDCIGGQEFLDSNFSANPLFCDTAASDFYLAANSRCAPAHNSCGLLIGALDTACADMSNTPTGSDVPVSPGSDVNVTFEDVSGEGQTDVTEQTGGPAPPGALATLPSDPTTYYNITTTATHGGDILVCLQYDEDDIEGAEWELKLQHHDDTGWVDITTSHDRFNNVICGITFDLSPFTITQDTAGNAPPTSLQRLFPSDSVTVTPPDIDFVWSRCIDPDADTITNLLRVTVLTVDTTFEVADTVFTLPVASLGLPNGNWEVNWWVSATDGTDTTAAENGRGTFTLDVGTAVRETASLPTDYALHQSYPNPFNASAVIEFALPEASPVRLEVFNVLGRRVRMLAQGTMPAGVYRQVWDGRDDARQPVPTGLYFYRLIAGDWSHTRRMMLLK